MNRMFIVAMIAIVFTCPLHAAPECDKYLKEIKAVPGKESGYGPKKVVGDEEYRCEGMYSVDTSAGPTELAVVSLTRGPIVYSLDPKLTLEVSVAQEIRREKGRVHVRALPRAEGKNYQMDATIPSDGRLVWPAGDVLEPRGIEAGQLGAYGTMRVNKDTVFVPLSVQVKDARPSGAPLRPTLLIMRYPYTLFKLGWKVGKLDSSGECVSSAAYSWQQDLKGRQPIFIDLGEASGNCLAFRLKRKPQSTAESVTLRVALPERR